MPDGKTNRNGGAPALRGHVVDAFAEDLLRAVARGLRIPPEFLNMVPVDHRLAWAQTTRDMHISRGPVPEKDLAWTYWRTLIGAPNCQNLPAGAIVVAQKFHCRLTSGAPEIWWCKRIMPSGVTSQDRKSVV